MKEDLQVVSSVLIFDPVPGGPGGDGIPFISDDGDARRKTWVLSDAGDQDKRHAPEKKEFIQ